MRQDRGFTLIELLITVAVVAILAAIALPSYRQYITRGKIQEAGSTLADLRNKMEQYYMDNHRYSPTAAGGACAISNFSPTTSPYPTGYPRVKYFSYSCTTDATKLTAAGDQAYTITATGIATEGTGGFTLTINESNVKATTTVPSDWTLPATSCWVQRKNGSC